MKLKEWAKRNGVTARTAYRWFHTGVLPVAATQLSTGTILIDEPPLVEKQSSVAVYARVSSHDQRDDLERQAGRVAAAVTANGSEVSRVVTEVGSGLNGSRPHLKKLLGDASVGTIAVEHRDRLGRFGVDYVEAALAAQNRRLFVVDEAELDDDLVRDMVDVLTSFCARLYGRRSAKTRAQRALAAMAAQGDK